MSSLDVEAGIVASLDVAAEAEPCRGDAGLGAAVVAASEAEVRCGMFFISL